jgi:hypothetical protein
LIIYDTEIDIKIILAIENSKTKSCNHSDLRYQAHAAPNILDKHIDNLEKWGLIKNHPPKSAGHARTIVLDKPLDDCISKISQLYFSLCIVNDFFPNCTLNHNE